MNTQKRDELKTIEEIILRNTGYDTIEKFLDTDKPYEIKNLDILSDKIKEAIKNGEQITIVGDYDVDGITASSIMYLTLKEMGAKVKVRLPRRLSEGFGLSEKIVDEIDKGVVITVDNGIAAIDAIKKAKEKGLTVYVTDHHLPNEGKIPEADIVIDPHLEGTADFENYCGAGIAYKLSSLLVSDKQFNNKMAGLAALGTVCDVMKLNEDNRAIVINGMNNMTKEKQQTFGLYCLLKKYYKEQNVTMTDIGFTLGPTLNAPGRLQDKGALESLKALTYDLSQKEYEILDDVAKKIGYKEMFGITFKASLVDSLSKPWTVRQISMISPFNTIDKSELNELKSLLTSKKEIEDIQKEKGYLGLTDDNLIELKRMLTTPHTPEEIVKEPSYNKLTPLEKGIFKNLLKRMQTIISQIDVIYKYNIERKQIVEDQVMPIIEAQIEANNMQNDFPLVVYIPNQPEGVMGIIAGKLTEKYDTPAMVFTDSEDPDIIKGSARTAREVNIKELLDKIPEEFFKYGGHAEAAGISIVKSNFEHARQKLMENCFEPLGYVKDDTLYYDLEIDAKDIPNIFSILEKYEPYGEGNPPIVFKVKNFQITPTMDSPSGIKYMGTNDKYVKFSCDNLAAFGDTDKYTETIAEQLLFEISKFAQNDTFTEKQKDMIGYALSYFTGFNKELESRINNIFDAFPTSDEFRKITKIKFDLVSENPKYKKIYDFDDVAEVMSIATNYDVIGTLSVNYFKGKNLQIDIMGMQDPDRNLEKIKDKIIVPEKEI